MSWQSGFQFRVTDGPDGGKVTHLNYTRMTIGRARTEGSQAEGWLLLFDKSVSRQHAELVWSEEHKAYTLRHLSKTNYTWVDDQPLESETILRLGQEVKIGGSRLRVEAAEVADQAEQSREESPLAPGGELTERINVKAAAAALSLRSEESPQIKVVEGPDKGTVFNLNGFYLTVGRDSVQADQLHGDKQAMKFDQLVQINDPEVLPNHLILKWDELKKGFAIWKNPGASECPILRESDGFVWQTNLTDQGGVVREGDRVLIGQTTLGIRPAQATGPASTIRPVPLTVSDSLPS